MLQFPADAHDTASIPEPVAWRAAMPGILIAVPQWPFTWLTTNAALSAPPAVQFPADPHDTDSTMPGTLIAEAQVPFTSLPTHAAMPVLPPQYPPALQFPAD